MRWFNAFLALLLVFIAVPGIADGMRCGTKLVVSGDSKATVLAKCGEPMMKETLRVISKSKHFGHSTESGNIDGSGEFAKEKGGFGITTETTEVVEQWTYDPGWGQFLKLVVFRAGKLESINNGERGGIN